MSLSDREKHKPGVMTVSKETHVNIVIWHLEILLSITDDSKFVLDTCIVYNFDLQQIVKNKSAVEELSVVGYKTYIGNLQYVSYT